MFSTNEMSYTIIHTIPNRTLHKHTIPQTPLHHSPYTIHHSTIHHSTIHLTPLHHYTSTLYNFFGKLTPSKGCIYNFHIIYVYARPKSGACNSVVVVCSSVTNLFFVHFLNINEAVSFLV